MPHAAAMHHKLTNKHQLLSTFILYCYHVCALGDIMLFDKKTSGTCKLMAKTRCEAVDCAWSPCGRYLMTATTAPRLRVDNGIKVFTYYGGSLATRHVIGRPMSSMRAGCTLTLSVDVLPVLQIAAQQWWIQDIADTCTPVHVCR